MQEVGSSPLILAARHTTAMALLRGGVDISVIAIRLSHETTEATQIYLHAGVSIKNVPWPAPAMPAGKAGRSTLLAFLEAL